MVKDKGIGKRVKVPIYIVNFIQLVPKLIPRFWPTFKINFLVQTCMYQRNGNQNQC